MKFSSNNKILKPKEKEAAGGVGNGTDNDQVGPKEACWQCFKLAFKADCKQLAGKFFCKEACANVFRAQNLLTCQCKPKCPKQFLKQEGIGRFGKYFCSELCLEQDEDI